jgi:23S rRNA pseudouridine1911/1915/1917 synthase
LKNKSFAVDRKRNGVKTARLTCKLLGIREEDEGKKKKALWSIRLYTGRTHQIRVQFSTRKAPLSGDGKYGGREKRGGLALWSYKASFTHPITNRCVSVASLPELSAYPWCLFYDVLSTL